MPMQSVLLRVLSLPMRNWNLLNGASIIIAHNRFESTYEELKLQNTFPPAIAEVRVLSLPMRNWNFWRTFVLENIRSFWVYLWGIETYITYINFIEWFYVLSLPMRNWNTFGALVLATFLTVLSLPMRNWNYRVLFPHLRLEICFESTYEELKLYILLITFISLKLVLSLPMRNWN